MSERLSLSIRHAEKIREAEAEAGRQIDAAVMLGEVDGAFFVEKDDDWWLAVFGMTETEMEELKSVYARRYRRARPWRRAERRELLDAYIRISARLTVPHGLETVWR